MAEQFDLIKESIINFETEKIVDYVNKALNSGASPIDIIERGIRPGAELAGNKFEKGEFYLTDLVMTGEVIKKAMMVLEPILTKEVSELLGVVVLATVQGDLHDIGKNLVSVMLKGNGFKVIDLGVDVSPEDIVKAVKENDAKIVCLSVLITPAFEGLSSTIKALEQADLRGEVKIILGGAAVSPETVKRYKADFYGHNATDAVKICKQIVKA